MTTIKVYDCPSDPGNQNLETPGQATQRIKGNYVVNWGNMHYDQDTGNEGEGNPYNNGPGGAVVYFGGAPFALDRSFGLQSITDGTSNTLLMSEVVNPAPKGSANYQSDHRGDIYNDDWNCAMFMGYTPPNTRIPDQVPVECVYPFGNNPPCVSRFPAFNAARSFHSGGVNALMADGSVRFAKNSIAMNIWQALSTSRGGEVIGANQY